MFTDFKTRIQILIKEDYITLTDIVLSVLFCIRINFFKVNFIKFDDVEISSLINEE